MKSWSDEDLRFMSRALELASGGLHHARPNPMVGCVIVAENGLVIGEGFHRACGQAHAEVEAFESIKAEDKQWLPKSTWYVTLEPCNHHGRTPACSQFILQHPPKRIVIATQDTNERVNGQGIQVLRSAGIDVQVGCLEDKARWQNRRFFKTTEFGRPWVVLKWAQSSDGFIDGRSAQNRTEGAGSMKITEDEAQMVSHQWRAEEAAILIGANTALIDDPLLNVRRAFGPSPRRIVLDPSGRAHAKLRVWQAAHVDVLSGEPLSTESDAIHVVRAPELSNSEHFCVWEEQQDLADLLKSLWQTFNMNSILVEGGSMTLNSFIEADLWDEIKIWTSPHQLSNGLKAPELPINAQIPNSEVESGSAGVDRWNRYINASASLI